MDNSENEVLKLQKEKKGKNIVIIILVFIVALLLGIILCQYIPNNKNDKKTENIAKDEIKKNNNSTTKEDEKQNTSTNTNDTSTSTSTSSSDNSNANTVQKSDSDIVKELFIQNLKNIYGDNLIEYRIDNIKIYTGSEREELAQMYENNSNIEIYSLVNYSIRLKDISKDAGNGTESGDWVYDKTACVTIIKDANGNRSINAGTGW